MTPIAGIVGGGLVGTAVTRHLTRAGWRVAVYDVDTDLARSRVRRYGAIMVDDVGELLASDVVVLCGPPPHTELVRIAIQAGIPVVSVSDDIDDVRSLLQLDRHGSVAGPTSPVVIGAAMAPGLTALLARYLADRIHVVDELHVAIHGTGGPACARQHHLALGSTAIGWHDGAWIERPGGSGRELCWFPEPSGPHDCYRAGHPDPLLLHRAFPDVIRISARVSGTRRDRMTARLPMLTPPHRGGNEGAVRVEARGADANGSRVTAIVGSAGFAADLAGAVCAASAMLIERGVVPAGINVLGCDPSISAMMLDQVMNFGIGMQEFTGDIHHSSL